MKIQYKAVGARSLTDEGDGIITALVSVTGIVDNVNDIIEPGAYAKSLSNRTPKGVWHHSWEKAVAKTLEIAELMPRDARLPKTLPNGDPWPAEAGGLLVKMQFNLKTQRGRDAYEDVLFYGDQQEWSIGYNVPQGAATVKSGKRHIKSLDLYEYSPVLFGAMSNARTTSVKSAQEAFKEIQEEKGIENAEAFLIEVKSFLGDDFDIEQKTVEPDEDGDDDGDTLFFKAAEIATEASEYKGFLSAAQSDEIETAIKALTAILQKSDEQIAPLEENQEEKVTEDETKSLASLIAPLDLGAHILAKAQQFDEASDFAIVEEMEESGEPILTAIESAIDAGGDEKALIEATQFIVDAFKGAGVDVSTEAAGTDTDASDQQAAPVDDEAGSVDDEAESGLTAQMKAHPELFKTEMKTISLDEVAAFLND